MEVEAHLLLPIGAATTVIRVEEWVVFPDGQIIGVSITCRSSSYLKVILLVLLTSAYLLAVVVTGLPPSASWQDLKVFVSFLFSRKEVFISLPHPLCLYHCVGSYAPCRW
jgi:hypothetical protein